jgi:hypothetical protein
VGFLDNHYGLGEQGVALRSQYYRKGVKLHTSLTLGRSTIKAPGVGFIQKEEDLRIVDL